MADSDPTAFFRPKWHEPYWRRPRLFQQSVFSNVPVFKRRHTLDRFVVPARQTRPRRYSPFASTALYTGSISLLWGV